MQRPTLIIVFCVVGIAASLVLLGRNEEPPARPVATTQQAAGDEGIVNPALNSDERRNDRGLLTDYERSGTINGVRWVYQHRLLSDAAPTAGVDGAPTGLGRLRSDQGALIRVRATKLTVAQVEATLGEVLADNNLRLRPVPRSNGQYTLVSSRFVSRGVAIREGVATVAGIFRLDYCTLRSSRRVPELRANVSLQLACATRDGNNLLNGGTELPAGVR